MLEVISARDFERESDKAKASTFDERTATRTTTFDERTAARAARYKAGPELYSSESETEEGETEEEEVEEEAESGKDTSMEMAQQGTQTWSNKPLRPNKWKPDEKQPVKRKRDDEKEEE